MSGKIAIIGCGNVGSSVAYNLYNKFDCDIVLINHNKIRACSNALDILDGSDVKTNKIYCGDYSDICDANIVINCAGNSSLLRSMDRNGEFDNSRRIANDIISNITKTRFKGIFINVMNPCDEITNLFRGLNIDKRKIIGTGTLLETIRLRNIVLTKYNKLTSSIIAGNHGTRNCIICNDWLKTLSDVELFSLLNEVHSRVWKIYEGKGFTNFGITYTVSQIVDAILYNKNITLCVSTLCTDVYGMFDCCISVPCVLGRDGIISVVKNEQVQTGLNKLFRKEVKL